MLKNLTRTVIAGAAITGALTFGAAGLAGAATTTTNGTANPGVTKAGLCAKAEARVPTIQAREAKAAAWVPKAQAREAKATAAGHTKLATRIGDRITRVQKLEARGEKVLSTIAAKCGGATATS